MKNGVHETTEYLELFLRNLLLDEKNELHNRSMHISGMFTEVDSEKGKVDIVIKLLVDSEVIVPVTGYGKGKYRFQL